MTIKDIARESGCAIGTVSRVLNNHPDVSDITRKKVLDVVDKYGFVLNTNARQLKQQDRKNLVIIVKGTSNILLNSLLEGIQKKLEPLPYVPSVVVLDEYDNEAKAANRIFYEQKPLGMIFLGGNPKECNETFEKLKIPCVLISTESDNTENISSVSIDNFEAAMFSANVLIENGHINIGVIGGDLNKSETSKRRFQGFRKALEKSNISFDLEKQYSTAKYSFESGCEAVKKLLEKYPEVTAIFTMSDVMALGAIRQLTDMGIKVPEQVSVIGFDGIQLGNYYCPRLSTIKQLENELVDNGINILLNDIENKAGTVHKLVPFKFIPGESVKKIN